MYFFFCNQHAFFNIGKEIQKRAQIFYQVIKKFVILGQKS